MIAGISSVFLKIFPVNNQRPFHYCWLLLLCLLCGNQQWLAAQSFYIDAPEEVYVGEPFDVIYVLEDAELNQFKAPAFDARLKMVGGPNRSTSYAIINGDISKKQSIGYRLLVEEAGTYTLPAASVEVGGKVLKTKIFRVEAVQGNGSHRLRQPRNTQPFPNIPNFPFPDPDPQMSGGGSSGEAFMQLDLSQNEAVVGEQIIAEYAIYTTVNIVDYATTEIPTFTGFWTEDITPQQLPAESVTQEGKRYTRQLLKRFAIFPQQAATLEVPAMSIEANFQVGGGSFGIFYDYEERKLTTNTEKLQVAELPSEGAPDSFQGAVGNFSVAQELDKSNASVGEVLQLKVTVEGSGTLPLLQAPALQLPVGMVQQAGEVQSDSDFQSAAQNKQLSGKRVFYYQITPTQKGNFTFNPLLFSFFNPQTRQYETVQSHSSMPTLSVSDAAAYNMPAANDDGNFADDASETAWWKWLLYVLLLMAAGVFIFKGFRFFNAPKKEVIKNINTRKEDTAKKSAAGKTNPILTKTATPEHEIYQPKPPSGEKERALHQLQQYIQEQYQINITNISKSAMQSQLAEKQMQTTQIARLNTLINDLEQAIYGGVVAESSALLYERVQQWIKADGKKAM
ncbi:MAG: protein BatD [Sphingobacteriales bacterium]|nr:protein BatD [Sphingobacteriales bacterium]